MLNGVVDSQHVRVQKAMTSSQSTGAGSSFVSHLSPIEDRTAQGDSEAAGQRAEAAG
jgi:hypothetical protein